MTNKTRCPECAKQGKDKSGDNLHLYDDGAYCHACGYLEKNGDEVVTIKEAKATYFVEGSPQSIDIRGISERTARHFDYIVGTYKDKKVQIANYKDFSGKLVGQKIRFPDKSFITLGAKLPLFAAHLFSPNQNTFITITEGEIDALSVAEAQGLQWPVVSVPSGAGGAYEALKANIKYFSGFKHVVLAFDNDEAGKEATKQCIELFDPGTVRVAQWPLKDANEVLCSPEFGAKSITQILFNASIPDMTNIIDPSQIELDEIGELATEGYHALYPKLNDMINGFRSNHLYTLVARPKTGKTTLTKELALHLIDQKVKVGLLYLEENAVREAVSLWAMEQEIPMWQVDAKLKDLRYREKIKKGLQKFKDSGLYLYHHKGAIDAISVYKTMHYMIKGLGCQFIILDNISISIAGTDGTNERKLIDKMVFDLIGLINQTKATVLNIVHTIKNKKTADGEDDESVTRSDIFGSGAFAKFSHVVLGLEKTGEDKVAIKVLANRDKGLEGYADTLRFDRNTGRLVLSKDVIPLEVKETTEEEPLILSKLL